MWKLLRVHSHCNFGRWQNFLSTSQNLNLSSTGQIFKKTGKLLKLSEQQLLDCARGPFYKRNNGCKGGVVSSVLDYVKLNGVTENSSYPYPYLANDTFPCAAARAVTRIKDYVWPKSIDESVLKDLLVKIGPLSVSRNKSSDYFVF